MQHFAPQPGGHVFDQRQGPHGERCRNMSKYVEILLISMFLCEISVEVFGGLR